MISFKGVMLCNRPAQIQGSLQAEGSSGAGKPGFVSTVKPAEQIGLNPINKEYPVMEKDDPNNDVTYRHKKWLEEFQMQRDEMTEMLEIEVMEMEEAKKKFQQREAEKRAAIRAAKQTKDPEAIKNAFEGTRTKDDFPIMEESKEQEEEKPKASKIKAKPKWAMTEVEADDADEMEVDELLDFANNLDYDSYIDDMEVKEALNFIKKRVKELEAGMPEEDENVSEEEKEIRRLQWEEEKRKARDALDRARQKWADEGNEPFDDDLDDYDTASVMSTKEVLDGGLKQVHSIASVAKVMQKVSENPENTVPVKLAMDPPVVAITKTKEKNKGPDPSNLPYLHRHPAV